MSKYRFGFGLTVLLTLAGCTRYVVLDRLDVFVLSGFRGELPSNLSDCLNLMERATEIPHFRYPCNLGPAYIQPGGTLLWNAKAISSRDPSVPHRGIQLSLSVVNTEGKLMDENYASISPVQVHTGQHGNTSEEVRVTIVKPGVYHVRYGYSDKAAYAVGYSPVIIVQSY